MEQFKSIVNEMKSMYEPYHLGLKQWDDTVEVDSFNLVLPPWLCQSYVRDTPENHIKKLNRNSQNENCTNKRHYEDSEGNKISRKKMKKLRRISRRPEKPFSTSEKSLEKCSECDNPLGSKCIYKLCKKCCREKCFVENLDCEGHRILAKTRRAMAKMYANKEKEKKTILDVL